jgi:hypothetical protein
LLDRQVLGVYQPDDIEKSGPAVLGMHADAVVEKCGVFDVGDRPDQVQRPFPPGLKRIVVRDANRNHVRADLGFELRASAFGDDFAMIDNRSRSQS